MQGAGDLRAILAAGYFVSGFVIASLLLVSVAFEGGMTAAHFSL